MFIFISETEGLSVGLFVRQTELLSFYLHVHVFYFISTPFFLAQPGVAYREAVFEHQVCLDVCLANQRAFVYEIITKVVLNSEMYMNRKKILKCISFF